VFAAAAAAAAAADEEMLEPESWMAAKGEGVLEIKCPYKASPGKLGRLKLNEYYMHQVAGRSLLFEVPRRRHSIQPAGEVLAVIHRIGGLPAGWLLPAVHACIWRQPAARLLVAAQGEAAAALVLHARHNLLPRSAANSALTPVLLRGCWRPAP
jgi:hypothetical protein